MFATLGRTWDLTKQSFAVLQADKEILLFPVMSTMAAILVSISFLLPLWQSGAFRDRAPVTPAAYVVLFLFYYTNYFVIIFFNSALVACANIRLSGGDPTVGDGLRIATERAGRIALWALVACSVGLLLNMIEQRSGKLGRIVSAILGLAWTLITFFMVPVIILEDRSIPESIKRSAELFRKNWGEEVASGFSFGLIFFLLAIPGLVLAFLLFAVHPVVGILAGVLYFLLLGAVSAALKGIFTVALYRYATRGEVSGGFAPELMQQAFGHR